MPMSCTDVAIIEGQVLQRLPKLPQELCDSIIDHLHDDSAALKTCALVCKAWLPSTSLHQFSTLACPPCRHFWNPGKYPVIEIVNRRFLCQTDECDFEHCLAMLTSSSRIASSVSALKLSTLRSHQPPFPYLRFSTLVQILSSLPRLRVIDFLDCKFEEDVPHPALCHTQNNLEVRFSTCLTRSTYMEYDSSRFRQSLGPVQRFVAGTSMPDYTRTDLALKLLDGTERARVDAYEVNGGVHREIMRYFDCFRQYVDFASSRVVTLHGPLDSGATLRPRFSIPPTLEELTYHPVAGFGTPIFTAFTNLRAVTLIGSLFLESDLSSAWYWSNIVHDLYAMPTPELRDVGIILQVLENKQYDLLEVTPADILFQRFRSSLAGQDWMRLVKCLARFPALQTLRLEMELQPYPIARGRLSSDIPGCICVTQEVAAASLPAAVLAMAKVSVVLGYCA